MGCVPGGQPDPLPCRAVCLDLEPGQDRVRPEDLLFVTTRDGRPSMKFLALAPGGRPAHPTPSGTQDEKAQTMAGKHSSIGARSNR